MCVAGRDGERSGARTERARRLGLASQWQRGVWRGRPHGPLWLDRETLEGRRQVRGWWWCADGVQPWLLKGRVPPLEHGRGSLTAAGLYEHPSVAGSWAFGAEGRPQGVQSSETRAALWSGRQRVTLASSVGLEKTGGRPNLHVHSAAWPQGLLWAGVWAAVLNQRQVVLALNLQFGGGD